MNLNELSANIRQWAVDRNLIEGAKPIAQMVKLIEEVGELYSATTTEEAKDAIGDSYVVMTILAAQHGLDIETVTLDYKKIIRADVTVVLVSTMGKLAHDIARSKPIDPQHVADFVSALSYVCHTVEDFTLKEAVESAWNEIKDRKGKMINGVFVKEADLPKL